MMIAKRRRARFKRLERMADNTERSNLIANETALWAPGSGGYGSAEDWTSNLDTYERSLMRASFARENARARMVFQPSMLRAAKLARRAKLASRIRRQRHIGRSRVKGAKQSDFIT